MEWDTDCFPHWATIQLLKYDGTSYSERCALVTAKLQKQGRKNG
uniref:Uncharacterized protein n=1 Tax=Arundo donax TaxID=35708 RepID=A0A0A9GX75_ARUDO